MKIEIPEGATRAIVFRNLPAEHGHARRDKVGDEKAPAALSRLRAGAWGEGRFRVEFRGDNGRPRGVIACTVERSLHGSGFQVDFQRKVPAGRKRGLDRANAKRREAFAETREKAIELLRAGNSRKAVADMLHVSQAAMYVWAKDAGIHGHIPGAKRGTPVVPTTMTVVSAGGRPSAPPTEIDAACADVLHAVEAYRTAAARAVLAEQARAAGLHVTGDTSLGDARDQVRVTVDRLLSAGGTTARGKRSAAR